MTDARTAMAEMELVEARSEVQRLRSTIATLTAAIEELLPMARPNGHVAGDRIDQIRRMIHR